MALRTHSRPGARADRRAATRDQLRGAVEQLFDEGTRYSEVSVDRLCSTAGLTRTTFYAYFEDKADLLVAWLEAVSLELADAMHAWLALAEHPDRDRLRGILDEVHRRYAPHAAVLAAGHDAALFDPVVDTAVRALIERDMDALRLHIEAGQVDGSINLSAGARETAMWLVWMIHRALQSAATPTGAGPDHLLDACRDVIWSTLYRPTAPLLCSVDA